MNDAERNDNGQYTHGFDKMCKCGRRKGDHLAEFPFPFDDMAMETLAPSHPNYEKTCEKFRLQRKK